MSAYRLTHPPVPLRANVLCGRSLTSSPLPLRRRLPLRRCHRADESSPLCDDDSDEDGDDDGDDEEVAAEDGVAAAAGEGGSGLGRTLFA